MKIFFPLIAFLIIIGCKDTTENTAENTIPKEEPQSEQNVVAQSNEYVTVYDYAGLEENLFNKKNDTTYVVNFWATWCKPCVKELPYFEQLGETMSEEKMKVVLVSLDFPQYMDSKVVPFIKDKGLKSEIVLLDDTDANTWIPKVSEEWTGSIPATLIFKNDQKKFYEKQFTYEELQQEVNSIL